MTGPRPATRQHQAPAAYLSADRSPDAGRPALPIVQPFELKNFLFVRLLPLTFLFFRRTLSSRFGQSLPVLSPSPPFSPSPRDP